MEAVVKPEPVWLLEDQAVLDGMKVEGDVINFPDIKDEFQKTDTERLTCNTFQNDAEMNEVSDDWNEKIKTEIVIEEHPILEESSECRPSYKGSGNTDSQECGEIGINTNKPDHVVTKDTKIQTVETLFECEVCGIIFAGHTAFEAHVRTHSGVRPYNCEMCSKCFTRSGILKEHMRIHTGDKPFKCDLCTMCFARSSTLKVHMNTHTGAKPFKCEVCSKCCTQSGNLKVHMKTHTRDKPFKCEVCSMCFTQCIGLKRHMQLHTRDKP